MEYNKSLAVQGAWAKGSAVVSGTRAKLVTETKPIESQFKNKDGTTKMQDVAKARFEGGVEDLNISLNRATIDGLIDAFGKDSKDWIGHPLTAITEKVVVGGKRVTAVYLVPDGFELKEDDGGYVQVVEKGGSVNVEPDEVSPDSIPF
jgi:hypothetical protein